MISSKCKGSLSEEHAVSYLLKHGYRILDRNYLTDKGELDICCLDVKSKELVFVEVKSCTNITGIEPGELLTRRKLNKILKTIAIYMSKHKIAMEKIRIDLIGIKYYRGWKAVSQIIHEKNLVAKCKGLYNCPNSW